MKNKIIFLVNVDSFFVSHRLPIAKELLLKEVQPMIETHLKITFFFFWEKAKQTKLFSSYQ